MGVVLHYDRCDHGCTRGIENTARIRRAMNGAPVEVSYVDRPRNFGHERGAESLLLQEPFPYDGVIINGSAVEAAYVMDAARMSAELGNTSFDRIVFLHSSTRPCELAELGIRCVRTTGGNGYLNPNDASAVAAILSEL